MASGYQSDSLNGRDDGSLTVAQIRTPSTPLESDMDPFSDFRPSGRDDVVTVKDVEEIVEAVRSSFAKFIETQRGYLDSQSEQSTSSEESSKNEYSAESTPSSQPSSEEKNEVSTSTPDNELTEATVSDIIEAIEGHNDLLKNDILDSIDELKTDIYSKTDSISNEISEKLIESSKNENTEKNNEFLSNDTYSNEEKASFDSLLSFTEYMTERSSELTENSKTEDSLVSKIGSFFNSLFGEEDNSVEDGMETEGESITDERSSVSSSLTDMLSENAKAVDILKVGVDEVYGMVGGIGDMAKSMVEMAVQDSMIKMVTSDTVDGLSLMMSRKVDETFGDAIRMMGEHLDSSSTDETITSLVVNDESANKNDSAYMPPNSIDTSKNVDNGTSTSEVDNAESGGVAKDVVEKPTADVGGLLDIVGNVFDKITSLFRPTTENEPASSITTTTESANDEQSVKVSTVITQNVVDDGSDDTASMQTSTAETVAADNATADNESGKIDYDKLEDVVDKDGILEILDTVRTDVGNILREFREHMQIINGSGTATESVATTTSNDVLMQFSGTATETETYNGNMSRISIAAESTEAKGSESPSETKTTEERVETSDDGTSAESSISEICDEIAESREYLGGRFDELEEILKSGSGSSGGTQVVYMSAPETKFEVDRIG